MTAEEKEWVREREREEISLTDTERGERDRKMRDVVRDMSERDKPIESGGEKQRQKKNEQLFFPREKACSNHHTRTHSQSSQTGPSQPALQLHFAVLSELWIRMR